MTTPKRAREIEGLHTDRLIIGAGGAGLFAASRFVRIERIGEHLQVERVPVEFSIVRPGESLLDEDRVL